MDRNFQHRIWERAQMGSAMGTYQTFQAGPRKGQPKTLTDRVVRFLTEGLKFTEVPSKNKYRVFTKGDHRYYVGKAGAVRAGRNVTESVSLTDRVRINMELWERKEGLK